MGLSYTLAAALPLLAAALDDGLARTPPMGWRSWNTFGTAVDQQLMVETMDLLASRDRLVDGSPTSLCDLGYCDVGLDDGWQLCGAYGPDKNTFHQESGAPVLNHTRFPDMEAMTTHAHALGLTAGWYFNNCVCADHCSSRDCYHGDALVLYEFGFDGVKLDGCSAQLDLDTWHSLIRASSRPVVIENCHWGRTLPNATWCPFHFYRTSNDIVPTYASVVANLQTVAPLAAAGLSKPGCWAYPDMLEVGTPNGAAPPLSAAESRSHFGAWCISSAPLILSHDLRDKTVSDAAWPLISNREAIVVNQAWAGASGSPFLSAQHNVSLSNAVSAPAWQYWSKPLRCDGSAVAVLLMNHADGAKSMPLRFADVPMLGCSKCAVRDVWGRKDLGVFDGAYVGKFLAGHDAAFLVLSRTVEAE
mmetsp:Transcript_25820/g.59715  ORF Transcript_25820/g.59715 Transcript_25820/m.59715 type:complete len:417 (-) Transcript_25820:50-1300(-)